MSPPDAPTHELPEASTQPNGTPSDSTNGGTTVAEMDHALAVMRDALAAHPLPTAFSEMAWAELLKRESEFVTELGLESVRLARQKRSDVVARGSRAFGPDSRLLAVCWLEEESAA